MDGEVPVQDLLIVEIKPLFLLALSLILLEAHRSCIELLGVVAQFGAFRRDNSEKTILSRSVNFVLVPFILYLTF